MPDKKCRICGDNFYVKPAHVRLGYGKFCSVKCRSEGQRKGKLVECAICGKSSWKMPKQLRRSKSGKFFCSKSCQTIWRNRFFSGANHPFWKGGERAYKDILLRTKIPMVCRLCHVRDKRILIVHHIDKNRKHNETANLIWLCQNCHYLVHHYESVYNKLVKILST